MFYSAHADSWIIESNVAPEMFSEIVKYAGIKYENNLYRYIQVGIICSIGVVQVVQENHSFAIFCSVSSSLLFVSRNYKPILAVTHGEIKLADCKVGILIDQTAGVVRDAAVAR